MTCGPTGTDEEEDFDLTTRRTSWSPPSSGAAPGAGPIPPGITTVERFRRLSKPRGERVVIVKAIRPTDTPPVLDVTGRRPEEIPREHRK